VSPTRTCSSHCRSCRRHFAGDVAFDKHLGKQFHQPCRHPEDVKSRDGSDWFEAIEGECRISGSDVLKPITIWRQAGVAERVKGLGRREAVEA
jgi:hypothetical protein